MMKEYIWFLGATGFMEFVKYLKTITNQLLHFDY